MNFRSFCGIGFKTEHCLRVTGWIGRGFIFLLCPFSLQAQLGETLTRNVEVAGTERSYELWVPSSYDGTHDWPLVIHYHGADVPLWLQKDYTRMHLAAAEQQFLMAFPIGLEVYKERIDATFTGWVIPGDTVGEQDDVVFTNRLIDDIARDYRVDPGRIHATGWSNGALMSDYLACVLSDRIASVATVAGGLTHKLRDTVTPKRPISNLTIWGTEDAILLFEGDETIASATATVEFFASLGDCAVEPIQTDLSDTDSEDGCTVTLFDYANCDPNIEVLFYRINEGGHTWPGATQQVYIEFAGPLNQDINASSLILEFFTRNPLPEEWIIPWRTNNDWREAQFTAEEQADALISGLDADPDQDGLTNLQEYVHGTLPKIYDFVPVILSDANGDYIELSFPWVDGIIDAYFQAELGDDLETFSPVQHTVIESNSSDGVTRYLIRINIGNTGTSGFVKLRTILNEL